MSGIGRERRVLVTAEGGLDTSSLRRALAAEGTDLVLAASPSAALEVLEKQDIEVIFLAAALVDSGESDFIISLVQRFPDVPIVILVENPATLELTRWFSAGASDSVRVPLDPRELLFAIHKIRSRIQSLSEVQTLPEQASVHEPTMRSPAMRRVFELVERVAVGRSTVMIRGESGTGKEVVARLIHSRSPLGSGPFMQVHCGALPEQILESELFGYERGAFTGAFARKPGRVELAEGGTLFLDEIGDISLSVQVKLLRLLQDREYERLGGTQTFKANVRFITATHRNLEKMVRAREFREDLYYRLNVVRITLPPLRERPEDIAPLARHFCALFCANNAKSVLLNEACFPILEQSAWRGNVRQLQNFMERLVVLNETSHVSCAEVTAELARDNGLAGDDVTSDFSAVQLDTALKHAERRALERALHRANGNRVVAARILGVSRRTLFYKLRAHSIG